MSGEPGEAPQSGVPAREVKDIGSYNEAAQKMAEIVRPQPEAPAWSEVEIAQFKDKLVKLGIISGEEPKPENYELPATALPTERLEEFLRAHGAADYVESQKDAQPEERRFRMHELYTAVYSEDARRKFEDSIGHSIRPPSSAG